MRKRDKKTEKDKETLVPLSRCHVRVFVSNYECVCVCVCLCAQLLPSAQCEQIIKSILRGENSHSRPPYLPSLLDQTGVDISLAPWQNKVPIHPVCQRDSTRSFILLFNCISRAESFFSSTSCEMFINNHTWF